MKNLGKVLEQTSWLGVTNTLNNNSDTLYEAITQLENVTTKNAGYFLSEDALKSAVPNPTMGMIAYVRDLNSGVYYLWNTYLKDNVPTWTGTTTTVPEPNISMDAIEGLEESVQDVNDKQDELTNRINTNSNNIEVLQNTVNTHNAKFSSVDDDITALQHDKQDKLVHYTEEDEDATIATRETISLHTEQQVGSASISLDATTSEVEISSTNHNAEQARLLLNNGNISIDADGKVSMSCDSGETVIEDVVGTIKGIVDYMAKDETDDDSINDTLNRHEARLGELTNSVQMLQDETEDLQSMRDTIDRLGTDKADKSALEATDKEVAKKQNKLDNYKENPSNGSVEIFSQDIVSMRNDSQGGVTSVEVYNEDNAEGIIPVARMSAEKENGDYAYVETRGNEVNIYGDYVNVNGFDLMQTIEDVATLNMRVYELGDFPTTRAAEDKAREPIYSGSDSISIIHYTVNGSTDGLILQHQDADNGYHRSVQTLSYHGRQYVRFVWFTDSTRTVLSENANFDRDWWETSISHLEYDKTTHTIKCRRIGQDVNRAKWITLPSASTSTDGLMTMAQVKSLEGKQDALQTYEETTDNAEVKMPNGNSYIRVTKDGAGMYAQDGKSGIVNSSSGSRLVYLETATDAKGDSYTSHRDDISIGRHDGNSATHITMTSRSTHEEAGAKITNTSTIQVNPEGISMSSPNGEIGDVVKEISGKASSESVSELRQEVEDKAPKVGYAPNLKVNFAKELVGHGEATEEVIGSIRPTGVRSIGDGNATIERIKGESVVWNQCVKNHDLTNGLTNWKAGNGTTLTLNDDGSIRVTISGKDKYNTDIRQTVNPIAGHKYAYYVEVKGGVDGQSINIILGGANSKMHTVYTSVTSISGIIKAQAYDIHFRACSLTNMALGGQVGDYADVYSAVLYDLTLMFGEGNEPTTIEEFEARKPLGVSNEYNEGTIVSYDGSALKSVGFNAYNGTYAKVIGGESYTAHGDITSLLFAKEMDGETTEITLDSEGKFIPADNGYVYANGSDVCIHLSHSYDPDNHPTEYMEDVHPLPDVSYILDANGNQLFLYGLLSAGSVHDEITATKAIKRVGVIDIGASPWARLQYASGYYYFRWEDKSVAKGKNGAYSNVLCKPYINVGVGTQNLVDKSVATYLDNNLLLIRDDAYTDVDSFKAANQGALLYYELAEPIEVDLPEPLNMTYEAWDFGTEELVAKSATTPLNADIVYQFNAVDRIRENSSAIDDLEENVDEVKNNQLQLSVKDNGNIVLYNSNGQSQEFMKATPSGDPMHWAYVSAGAEYNATNDFILKDAPWKDMVDTIEDKATWGLDVVDASRVKQMTIKGVEYNYATENRTSPEGGTYLRYFLVGKGSNNVWVEDETKVLHLPKCWYLNGLGDITDAEMLRCYEESPKNVGNYVSQQFGKWSKARTLNARISAYSVVDLSYLFVSNGNIEVPNIGWAVYNISNMFLGANRIRYMLNIRYPSNPSIGVGYCNTAARIDGAFSGATSLRGCFLSGLVQSVSFSRCGNISKPSILEAIKNATPSSAITITLHADAYARLKDDADIVAALAAKPLVTLVSA